MNDKAAFADQRISSTSLPPLLSWAFTSKCVLARCKNRPSPSPSLASTRRAPQMMFHRFDMQNCTYKRWNMICCMGMNPVTSKDWKLQCQTLPPIPSSLLSSLTASLIHSKRLLSKTLKRWARSNYFLYSPNACFLLLFTCEKISFCFFCDKKCFASHRIPKAERSLIALGSEPWSCSKISTSGVERSSSVFFTKPHLLSALLSEVAFSICFASRIITWSFATLLKLQTFSSKSLFHCVSVSGLLVHDDLGFCGKH